MALRIGKSRRLAVLASLSMLAQPASAAPPPGADPVFYRWAGPITARPGVMLRRDSLERSLMPSGAGVAERILYASTSGWGRARRIATLG